MNQCRMVAARLTKRVKHLDGRPLERNPVQWCSTTPSPIAESDH